jgi:hypothetical protein
MVNMGIEALARVRGQTFQQVKDNLSDADVTWINNWWHRRVFTRLIRNIHAGNYGLEYLQPRIQEVYELYREIGGRLTLEEILASQWQGVY